MITVEHTSIDGINRRYMICNLENLIRGWGCRQPDSSHRSVHAECAALKSSWPEIASRTRRNGC